MTPAISNIAMRTRILHGRFRGFRDDTAGLEGACQQAGKERAGGSLRRGLNTPCSWVEHALGSSRGHALCNAGRYVGDHALLQRRAARSREWVDRSPVGDVSGDLVVLEGLQNAA